MVRTWPASSSDLVGSRGEVPRPVRVRRDLLRDSGEPRQGGAVGRFECAFRVGADEALGGGGDGVGVPPGRLVQSGGRAAGQLELGGGGDCRAVALDDPVERLDRCELVVDAGQELLVVALVLSLFEHDVDVVLGSAAGEHRVEQLPVLGAGDDAVQASAVLPWAP